MGVTSNRRSRQRVRPLPKGNSLYTPDASAARQTTERRSARPLMFLYQLPTWVAPLVMVVLLVAGLAITGPGGAVALCGVAAVLGWLASTVVAAALARGTARPGPCGRHGAGAGRLPGHPLAITTCAASTNIGTRPFVKLG